MGISGGMQNVGKPSAAFILDKLRKGEKLSPIENRAAAGINQETLQEASAKLGPGERVAKDAKTFYGSHPELINKRAEFAELKSQQQEIAKTINELEKKSKNIFVSKGNKVGMGSAIRDTYAKLSQLNEQMRSLGFDPTSGREIPKAGELMNDEIAKRVGRLLTEKSTSGKLSIGGLDEAMKLAKSVLNIPAKDLKYLTEDDLLRELATNITKNQQFAYHELPLKNTSLLEQLNQAQGGGNYDLARKLTDQIREEATQKTPTYLRGMGGQFRGSLPGGLNIPKLF